MKSAERKREKGHIAISVRREKLTHPHIKQEMGGNYLGPGGDCEWDKFAVIIIIIVKLLCVINLLMWGLYAVKFN